jgi:hypothetical protein
MSTPADRRARQALARKIAAELATAGTTDIRAIDERAYRLTDDELDVINYSADRDLLPLQDAIRAAINTAGPQQCLSADPFAPDGAAS